MLSQLGQLAAARRAWRPVKVAGPTVTRDWTFAPDAAEAVWSLLTAESWQHDVYNVSCGYGLSFQQVVDAYVKHGLNATWVDDARDADVYMLPEDERVPLDIGRLRDASHGDVPSTELASGIEQILRSPDGRREE